MRQLKGAEFYRHELTVYLGRVLIAALAVVVMSMTMLIGLFSGRIWASLWCCSLAACLAYLWRIMSLMLTIFNYPNPNEKESRDSPRKATQHATGSW